MTNISNSSPRFAVCINNTDYPASLERHKIYQVIPDETSEADGDIRRNNFTDCIVKRDDICIEIMVKEFSVYMK